MNIATEKLLDDLVLRTEEIIGQAERLKELPMTTLNQRPHAQAWSALECLEHLNLYGDFYLPEIGKRISERRYPRPASIFRSGWLGNYFANSMLPKEKLNKMKTFRDKDPIGSSLDSGTIERFLQQQRQMLRLLMEARQHADLNRTRTAISISRLIRLKLGDTFRFVIYHNQRHMVQAYRAAGLAL